MKFLDLYEKHLYARRLVPRSVDYLKARLLVFAHWLAQERGKEDPRDVTLQDLLDFHSALRQRKRKLTGEPISANYCNTHLYALRGYYRFLFETGRILVDPCSELPRLRGRRALPKGVLSPSQAMKLLQQPNVLTLFGFRDRVILELLYSTGLRGLEVCRLSIYDVDLDDGTVTVRNGKGGKDRVVPLGKVAAHYVREYLTNVRPRMLARLPSPGAADRLFFSQMRRPLHPQMIYYMVRKNRTKASLPITTSTHSLRHTCATEMLRGGASVRHVQEMLGHSKITTTQIYTRVVPTDLKKVHAKTAPSERVKKIEAPTFKFNGLWHESTPHGPGTGRWKGRRKRRRKKR
jgi:integrase/recombinase XerD